jgi:hypothetical protein
MTPSPFPRIEGRVASNKCSSSRSAQHTKRSRLRRLTNFTLPQPYNHPSRFLGQPSGPLISGSRCGELLLPQRGVRTGRLTVREVLGAPVPKVAVHEDSHPPTGQYEVRRAALRDASVQPEPGALSVQGPSKEYLRRCVLGLATAERLTALCTHPTLCHEPILLLAWTIAEQGCPQLNRPRNTNRPRTGLNCTTVLIGLCSRTSNTGG